MKIVFNLSILILLISCSTKHKIKKVDNISNDVKSELSLLEKITDTIKKKPLTIHLLRNNNWQYKPFENCISKFDFNLLKYYDCEQNEENLIEYFIKKDTLFLTEYYEPTVDNPKRKTIKKRSDKYLFNGFSLIMVDSEIYSIGSDTITPKIEFIISYEMNKKN